MRVRRPVPASAASPTAPTRPRARRSRPSCCRTPSPPARRCCRPTMSLWHMNCGLAHLKHATQTLNPTRAPTDTHSSVRSAKKFPGYTSSNLSEKGVHGTPAQLKRLNQRATHALPLCAQRSRSVVLCLLPPVRHPQTPCPPTPTQRPTRSHTVVLLLRSSDRLGHVSALSITLEPSALAAYACALTVCVFAQPAARRMPTRYAPQHQTRARPACQSAHCA